MKLSKYEFEHMQHEHMGHDSSSPHPSHTEFPETTMLIMILTWDGDRHAVEISIFGQGGPMYYVYVHRL
jgi:hypothetical protein